MKNIKLTKAEEDIMKILWKLKNAKVKDILENFTTPKPAYNTVSTIVRILESKGVVDYVKNGKSHIYYPVLLEQEYTKNSIGSIVKTYFEGSYKSLVSFFIEKNDLSLQEFEALLEEIKNDQS